MSPEAKVKKPLLPAYLILGDDQPKVETVLQRLRKRIVEESGTELNIDEFSAQRDAAVDVVNAANTLAFLGGIRLVLVQKVDAWKKDEKERIVWYLRSPAPDACLALVGVKLGASDMLRKAVEKVGEVLEYQAPVARQLPEWTLDQARRLGVNLGMAEARYLAQRVGDSQLTILRELEKLQAYKGRGPVAQADIELLTPRTLEASIFALVDALAGRHSPEAFASVEELYAAGETPTSLFYRVLRHFQLVARVAALREAGPERDTQFVSFVQSELKLKPFHARKLTQQADALGATAARNVLGVLAESDARMKGMGDLPPELEFELCLGRILATR